MNETKVRILDTAERLIAERGLDVSLRTITAEAGVNLAAVNYHFQSKESLLEALVARRFDGMNNRRIEMLSALEAQYPEGPLPLEGVLEAFVGPVIDAKSAAPTHHRQLMGRLYTMPDDIIRKVFMEHMHPMISRFQDAFERAVPGLDRATIAWRMVLSIGSVVHLMSWSKILSGAGGVASFIDMRDIAELTRQIITFNAAGFRAAAQEAQGGEKQ